MTPSLMDKLRMMDTAKPITPDDSTPIADEGEPSSGFHYTCETFPLLSLCDRRFASAELLSVIFAQNFPSNLNERDFLFLDTETTGLSGGVGTVAFQVGLGYIENNRFVVEQFFMRDYHEEPAMLAEIARRCARFSVLVTFNGRSFDVPLLKSRLLMNRQRDTCFPPLHADVLFPARRLWKLRLGSCRLSRLEEALLGIRRVDDLEGALVPQTYFGYLKDRRFAPIERILKHNQQDIVSLAQLFFFLCMQFAKPEGISHEQDLLSLARVYEKQGYMAESKKCYRLSAKGSVRAQAFHALASQEKRQGHENNAIRLYSAMARRGDNAVLAYEALAKLAEHQKRDVQQALHYTRQALLFLAEPALYESDTVQSQRIALQYRYARLLRKQENGHHTNNQEGKP